MLQLQPELGTSFCRLDSVVDLIADFLDPTGWSGRGIFVLVDPRNRRGTRLTLSPVDLCHASQTVAETGVGETIASPERAR